MSDFISRQDAIEAVYQALRTPVSDYKNNFFHDSMSLAVNIVKNIPSVEPEQKWIPVTERLPEEREWLGTKQFGTTKSDEVYVTFENPKGERFCKHLSFQNGKLSRFDQSTIDAFYPEAKPIAWMPLPEPYRAEMRGE